MSQLTSAKQGPHTAYTELFALRPTRTPCSALLSPLTDPRFPNTTIRILFALTNLHRPVEEGSAVKLPTGRTKCTLRLSTYASRRTKLACGKVVVAARPQWHVPGSRTSPFASVATLVGRGRRRAHVEAAFVCAPQGLVDSGSDRNKGSCTSPLLGLIGQVHCRWSP